MPKLLLIILERPPLLAEPQLRVLADIGVAAGQLSAGAMVLPFVISGLDETKLPVIVLGIIFTVVCWTGSVLLVRKIES